MANRLAVRQSEIQIANLYIIEAILSYVTTGRSELFTSTAIRLISGIMGTLVFHKGESLTKVEGSFHGGSERSGGTQMYHQLFLRW